MKNTVKILIIICLVITSYYGCKKDKATPDATIPTISITKPTASQAFLPGDTIIFQATFSDDVQIKNYDIAISTSVADGWSYTKSSTSFDAGVKQQVVTLKDIIIPLNINGKPVAAGKYNMKVTCSDASNNMATTTLEINIGSALKKRIAFMQEPGMLSPQIGLQNALKDKGYVVDTLYSPFDLTASAYAPFDFTVLAGYDLVIISRAVSSSEFKDSVAWNALNVPVIVLSSWCARSTRLRLFNTTSVVPTTDGSLVANSLITNALPIQNTGGSGYDTVFHNVTTGGVAFPYVKWFYDFIDYYKADFVAESTGKLLAVFADDATAGAGAVVMARWEPNTTTYKGSGIHANYRTYMNLGADDDNGTAAKNFDSYTAASLTLFLNEVAFVTKKH